MVEGGKPKYHRPARELNRERRSDAEIFLNAPSRRKILAEARKLVGARNPRAWCTVVQKSSAVVSTEIPGADYWLKLPGELYIVVYHAVSSNGQPPSTCDPADARRRQLKFSFAEEKAEDNGDPEIQP